MPVRFGWKLKSIRPHCVIGDFNMTRGGAAIEHLYPGYQHAYRQAGGDWHGSFNRLWKFPLYHLDHLLLDESMTATRYDFIDLGSGRHYAQLADIHRINTSQENNTLRLKGVAPNTL